jgi:hypothetical protein
MLIKKTIVIGVIGICAVLQSSQMFHCVLGNLYSNISLPATCVLWKLELRECILCV